MPLANDDERIPYHHLKLSMLPSGVITFLFTDIQGSTPLWEKDPDGMREALDIHNAILRKAIQANGGQVFKIVGDEFQAAFVDPNQAVQAVVAAQRSLLIAPWGRIGSLRVRMGIHTGYAVTEGDDYAVAHTLNRVARIMSAADGGQILLSIDAVDQIGEHLPEDLSLRDMGRQQMKGMSLREHLFQLIVPGLPAQFPPLKTAVDSAQAAPSVVAPPREPPPEWDEEETLPLFVGRERELARLSDLAAGQVEFIIGGPGRGKTALVAAFARQAMAANPELLLLSGQCRNLVGLGEPFLPFRQVLSQLTGDVTDVAILAREQARRLWEAMPETIPALVAHGPDLIDSLLPGRELRARAASLEQLQAPWFRQIDERINNSDRRSLQQERLFGQVTATLKEIAMRRPLLIILEDLHWTDTLSASLLFHLSYEVVGSQISLLATYRPEEIADKDAHPLAKMAKEFKRRSGDIWLDLGKESAAEGRAFVDGCLDVEQNDLDEKFRQKLFEHTRGHALFTVELLGAMQERGDLFLDEDGRWQAQGSIDWETLPARVEGVIEQRLGRLDADLLATLSVASIEGETFTAEVVARVQKQEVRDLVRRLSRELEGQHRLVQTEGLAWVAGRRLSRYRFRHQLFQKHLYQDLDEAERAYLHEDVGNVLEAFHKGQTDEIAPQLAWHFSEAGDSEKTVRYLLQAGDLARDLYAHDEAIGHYEKALSYLRKEGKYQIAARTLMKLGLAYHNAFAFRRARQAYDEGFTLWQRAGKIPPAVSLPSAPHALRVDWFSSISTLDPAMAMDYFSSGVIDQLFSGLLEYTPDMEIVPSVARSWEVLDGGRRYLFHLRDDVSWSDGIPVTAEDFAYAWKRAIAPSISIGSSSASLLYDIKGARLYHQGELPDSDQLGIHVLDDTTLEVELEGPTSYFPHLLAYNVTYAVPRHVVEAKGEAWSTVNNIVTNGPFNLESWIPGETLVLARNHKSCARFTGNVEEVRLSLVGDPSARLEMFESDDLDVMILFGFPPEKTRQALQWHADEYLSGPFVYTLYLVFDVNQRQLADTRVRQALVRAIDREALADMMTQGSEFPATGGFVPPGMPGYSPGIGLPHNVDLARQLLADAGFPGGAGLPTLELLAIAGNEPVCEYLQESWWESLRVRITWETGNMDSLISRLYVESPAMYLNGWLADYPDPDNFLRVSRRAGAWGGWRNEAYEVLLKKAKGVLNQKDRIKFYTEADRILMDEAAIMPLTYGRRRMLIKPWIRRYPTSALRLSFWKDSVIGTH